jgi:hypothetical protein
MIRKIEIDSICEYDGCDKKATDIVYSIDNQNVMLCCEVHADIVQDEQHPEYRDTCPNCGCRNPIN